MPGERNQDAGERLLPNGAAIIAAENCPALLTPAETRHFAALLRSEAARMRGENIVAARKQSLTEAVLGEVSGLEHAKDQSGTEHLYAHAHEIRGLAGMAGLSTAGRIANDLCHYLDALPADITLPDPMTVELHVRAIGRAARAPREAEDLGTAVAETLNRLAARNLTQTRSAVEPVRDAPPEAAKPDAP
ncbi:MAG: hypothetical protein J0H10_04630 [Alphaproteobacteria bacterium]|jgi:chemotaxis protein histidine kinase CheA|nr:hypothetical protein [Alphaproteobacteria bacterium]